MVYVLPAPDSHGPRVGEEAADEEDVDVPQPELGVGDELATGLGGVVDAVDLDFSNKNADLSLEKNMGNC